MSPRKLANYAELCTDPDELRDLAKHLSPLVRFRVALNMYTPVDVLVDFLSDPDKGVRNGVACNENLPEEEMQKIAELPGTLRYYKQKLNLIDNPACPKYILEQLANDGDIDVAESASARLKVPGMKSSWQRDDQGVLRLQRI